MTALRAEVRETARLAAPLVVAQAAIMAMGLVDTAFVGSRSGTDLGGVALGNAVAFAVLSLGIGIPTALDPLISQASGAGDHARAAAWWRLGARGSILVGLPVGLLAVVVCHTLHWFGVEPALEERAVDYAIGRVPSAAFILLYIAARGTLQAYGRTSVILRSAIAANLVNALADALLVWGDDGLVAAGLPRLGIPPLGAFGAAIATSASSAMLALSLVRPVAATPELMAAGPPTRPVSARVLARLGVPLGLQQLAETGVFSVTGIMAGRLGPLAAGAHQVSLQLASFTFMAVAGVAAATSVRVGQAIGAGTPGAPRRAGLIGAGVGAVFMLTSALVFLTLALPIARALTPNETYAQMAAGLLHIAAFFQLFDGLQAVMAGALRGAGDVRIPFLANVAAHWGVGFPVAWALAFPAGLGATGLWLGLTASLVVVSLALLARFMRLSSRPISPVESLPG